MAEPWENDPIDHNTSGANEPWKNDPVSDVDKQQSKEQKYGALESGLAGLESGVTAGWGDEIRAAGKASGIPDVIRNHVPGSSISAPLIGAARLAYEHLTGQPGEASRVYDETVKAHRERSKGMQEEHPWAYGAGDLAGSILPMAAFPMEGAATIPAKMAQAAKAGAAYGAVSGAGEGEGLKDSAIGAGVGAVAGGLGGAAAVPVGEAASWLGKKAYDYTAGPIVNTIKGLANPEKEAQRRFVGSVVADAPQVASGKAQGLTPQDWTQAYADGEPVMLGDLGGARTKALLRSSTNSSPEGRDIAESAIGDRFFTQADRVGSTIRGLVDGGANAAKTKAQLQAEYDAERNIAYTRAYDNGDRPINSPELERLMGSKAVGAAVKDAIENGQDRAIAQGYSGAFRSPYTVTPDGRVVKNPGTSGVPAYPNLAFWDQTYRSLRDSADQAFRAGRNNEGGALKTMANSMRFELDRMIPSYANARGIASTYFGGSSALEAGQKAVTSNAPIEKLRQAMSKMGPAEKEMFQEAYADTWASNIEKAPRNRDLTSRADLANSINADRKLGVVFGQQKADRIAALAQREKIYDASRKVLGNSTTVRQMIEAGLAGGAIGSFLDGGQGGLYGAVTGAGSMLHHAPRALVKTATGYVNRNVAKHVAELYTSDDPMKVQRGLAMIAKNQSLREGFARIRGELEKVIGATQASDQANKQRASGGAVNQENKEPIVVDTPDGPNPLGGHAWNVTPSSETDIDFNDPIGRQIQKSQAEDISNLFHRIPEDQATTSYEPRGVRGGIHRVQEGFSHHSPHEPSKDLDFLQWIEGSQPDVKKDWADGKAAGGRVTNSAKTRKESHYSSTRGNTEHHCGPVKEWSENSCIHYKAGNKCNIVGGFIANRGGCDWFKNIKNRANGEAKINHSPSEAQKEAGNYKKDHISIHGLDISIENAKGSTRSGISKDGKKWSVKMPAQYGYIKGSTGADEDHIDVYVGPNHKSDKVFVVNQKDAETGAFDEHKSFICFSGLPQVKNIFMKAFSDGKGKNRMGHITEMSILEFKKFIEAETDRNTKTA